MNVSSDDEVNNDEDATKSPFDGEILNAFYNNAENNYEVTPDPTTHDEK